MSIKYLESELELVQFIKENKKVVVEFYADWCGPCKRISKTYEALSETFKDIAFAKLEMEGKDDLAVKYNIEVYPTFKFYHQEKEVTWMMGANQDKLKATVNSLQMA